MASGRDYRVDIKIGGSVDPSLAKSAQSANGILGSIVTGSLIADGIKAVAGATKEFISDAVDTYAQFNQAMANTAAISGATADEYQLLNDAAREAGKATSFTASEAADALGYMALAGWDVTESTEALQPVLKLAQATQADLATTSDQVTDSMSAMGVGIDELNTYLDVLVATNNNANTTASDLMDAFIGVGGAAKSAGMSYQQTATALGILANNGIKGSEAGTALNSILVRMSTKKEAQKAYEDLGVAIYDASGNMRSMRDILVDVNTAMDGMTDAEKNSYMATMAGTAYYTDFSYLLSGVQEGLDGSASSWDTLSSSIENSNGALDTMNGTVTGTMSGAMDRLNSAVDDVKLSLLEAFGDDIASDIDWIAQNVMPGLSDAMVTAGEKIGEARAALEDFCTWITDTDAREQEFTTFLQENKTALELAAIAVGTLGAAIVAYNAPAIAATVVSAAQTAAITAYCVVTDLATAATSAFSAVLAVLTSPVTIVIAAIGGLIAIGCALYNNWDTVCQFGTNLADTLSSKFPWMADIVDGAFATISGIANGLKTAFGGLTTFVSGVFSGNWSKAWSGIVQTFSGIWNTLKSVAKAPLNGMISLVNSAISKINGISVKIPDWVPSWGGKTFGMNLKKISYLATGGVVTGPTPAVIGEGGEPEAVIPLSRLSKMLGVDVEGGSQSQSITFAPQITISGNASRSDVEHAMSTAFDEFKRMMERYEREKTRRAFA